MNSHFHVVPEVCVFAQKSSVGKADIGAFFTYKGWKEGSLETQEAED
jgi:hypothetical protein